MKCWKSKSKNFSHTKRFQHQVPRDRTPFAFYSTSGLAAESWLNISETNGWFAKKNCRIVSKTYFIYLFEIRRNVICSGDTNREACDSSFYDVRSSLVIRKYHAFKIQNPYINERRVIRRPDSIRHRLQLFCANLRSIPRPMRPMRPSGANARRRSALSRSCHQRERWPFGVSGTITVTVYAF